MSLRDLPYEIISYVVRDLDLDDVLSLAMTSRRFAYLIHEPNICKRVLELNAPYSPENKEAKDTHRYPRALRRYFKRQEAISSASPYLVAIVAVAESYIYAHGTLCYIYDRTLRILNLHKPESSEIVVDIRKMLDVAIEESRKSKRYKFRLLYSAYDIISCLYTHSFNNRSTTWLVVFHVRERKILTFLRLESSNKIFVRNNEEFLFFGTHSDVGEDGFRRWTLKGYNVYKGRWLDRKLQLAEFAGSDLDSTVCFEIFGDHFYGVSNQTTFEVEELEYVSYYNCFRFPLDQPDMAYTEWSSPKDMWRRHHAEGPIDDRWTFLKLRRDETTGQLQILESRKEWLSGQSSGRRSYYTTDLVFTDEGERDSLAEGDFEDSDDEFYPENDRWVEVFEKENSAHEGLAQSRNPHYVHPGDDGSTSPIFTPTKSHIRSYHPSCQSFMDLVDDPPDEDPSCQRLRIRVGSRRLWSETELEGRESHTEGREGQRRASLTTDGEVRRLYTYKPVTFWPPTLKDAGHADLALDALNRIVNPPNFRGNVSGTWDDRCLIYGTGGGAAENAMQAIVFISFDPGIYLEGLKPFRGGSPEWEQPDPPGSCGSNERPGEDLGDRRWEDKGNHQATQASRLGAAVSTTGSQLCEGSKDIDPANDAPRTEWCSRETPMYRAIGCGYHFAL